jgi:hypothetical protein
VEVLQPFDPDTASKDELEAYLRNLDDQLSKVGEVEANCRRTQAVSQGIVLRDA